MGKPGRVMSVSVNYKPYVRRVVRDGRAQKAFAANIGNAAGSCVAGKIKGQKPGKGAVIDALKSCTAQYKGIHYSI